MIIENAELKRRYLQRIAGARDKNVYIGPEIVALNISSSCNLTCKFCWYHAPGNPNHFQKGHFLSWDNFVSIVDDCVDMQVDHVQFTDAGEPTLNPHFPEMMRHMDSLPMRVSLFTNATFPIEYCDDVIKADHVLIDIGAVDQQQYVDVHGKDLFGRVIENIERLVALRDSTKPDFFIEIVYVINSLNVKQKEQMKKLADRLKVGALNFVKMNLHQYNQEIALPDDGPDSDAEDKKTPPACLNGWFYTILRLNGSTSPCCRLPEISVGDLKKQSFKEIWHSKRMMNMRLLGKYGYVQEHHKACLTCPFYDENVRRYQDMKSESKARL